MSYEFPPYVHRFGRVRPLSSDRWDDWDPYAKIALPDPELKAKLTRTSNCAITAFSLGCAEWVVGALPPGDHLAESVEYLEAFWVYVFGFRDAVPTETEDNEWKGPIRGPVNLCLMTVLNTIILAEFGSPAQNGAFAASIAMHVLGNTTTFLTWRNVVVERLLLHCERDADNEDGGPIPRELLDPSRPYDPGEASSLVQSAIDNVDFRRNRWLRTLAI
ncbi:hypothetical protein [Sphaerotilus microaerophilus]|uniref:Uncharacterized protein n=1 Tax=Sphaerotilus microaerophilus TaxID=2914710 RepID=A0ABM7YKA7_9BURK|nr:hypothetical protein [Sphaerotilus sp. FB-5]BDI04849.1 hypothetical protein CATMQ487_18190 [Sphaerotilus sp. FB-5]